jgi:hypothetical protein
MAAPALRAAVGGGIVRKECLPASRGTAARRPSSAGPRPSICRARLPILVRAAPPRPPTPPPATQEDPLARLRAWTRTDVYRGPVQIAVFLIVFMLFDACYSGDWSRIGAISRDTEAALVPVTAAVAAVHCASAAVAWRAASSRGASPLWPATKALAVGVLAALQAVWDGGDEA